MKTIIKTIENYMKHLNKEVSKKTCANPKCISEKLGIEPVFEENETYCNKCLEYYYGWL